MQIRPVTPDPRSTPVEAITITFSEPVYGLDMSDLTLLLNGVPLGLGGAQTLTSPDGGSTWVLGNLWRLVAAGGQYSLVLNPVGSGIADFGANDLASGASNTWTITNPATGTAIAGRRVFYNRSALDGRDPAATLADLAAVAPDKQALFPGQASTASNITSYASGINGVMIDFAGVPPVTLGAGDFRVRVGTSADSSTWAAAPRPTVTLLPAPVGVNAARYALVWPDGSILNTWLEVTVLAGPRTGLPRDDVFYFGNLVGDTGDAAPARVTALDLSAVKRSLNSASTAGGRFDFNRDGRVNALDLAMVRANLNRALPTLTAPAAAALFSDLPVTHVWDALPGR
jgi:hypothetical protein